jgi:hypothetical protein
MITLGIMRCPNSYSKFYEEQDAFGKQFATMTGGYIVQNLATHKLASRPLQQRRDIQRPRITLNAWLREHQFFNMVTGVVPVREHVLTCERNLFTTSASSTILRCSSKLTKPCCATACDSRRRSDLPRRSLITGHLERWLQQSRRRVSRP